MTRKRQAETLDEGMASRDVIATYKSIGIRGERCGPNIRATILHRHGRRGFNLREFV